MASLPHVFKPAPCARGHTHLVRTGAHQRPEARIKPQYKHLRWIQLQPAIQWRLQLPSMSAHGPEEGKLARLLADAEQEMRRKLPDGNDGAPGAKRRKGGGGGGAADAAEAAAAAGGRFDYGAIKELATGITGFILTCPLQRWVQPAVGCGGLVCRLLLFP